MADCRHRDAMLQKQRRQNRRVGGIFGNLGIWPVVIYKNFRQPIAVWKAANRRRVNKPGMFKLE
jgi:hypothetical protein